MEDNWEIRLADYVAANADIQPELGKHDCLTFSNGAARAMNGKGFADDWLGKYMNADGSLISHTELQALSGFRRLHIAISDRLPRVDRAVRGCLVGTHKAAMPSIGTRLALGISLGNCLVYLGPTGLERVASQEFDYAWRLM